MDHHGNYVPEKAFRRALDVTLGAFIGGLNGARGNSVTSNAIESVISGGIINSLGALFGEQKFLSRETLVSTASMTAASAVMHALAKGASNSRHADSSIRRFEECAPCKLNPSWSERAEQKESGKEPVR